MIDLRSVVVEVDYDVNRVNCSPISYGFGISTTTLSEPTYVSGRKKKSPFHGSKSKSICGLYRSHRCTHHLVLGIW